MAEEAPDVLKEKQARLFGLDDAGQVEEEPPSVVVEPAPPSGDREGLAREARDEEVETRQLRCVDCSDVAIIGVVRKVLLVMWTACGSISEKPTHSARSPMPSSKPPTPREER